MSGGHAAAAGRLCSHLHDNSRHVTLSAAVVFFAVKCRMTAQDGMCSLRLRKRCEWEGTVYDAVTAVEPVPVKSGGCARIVARDAVGRSSTAQHSDPAAGLSRSAQCRRPKCHPPMQCCLPTRQRQLKRWWQMP